MQVCTVRQTVKCPEHAHHSTQVRPPKTFSKELRTSCVSKMSVKVLRSSALPTMTLCYASQQICSMKVLLLNDKKIGGTPRNVPVSSSLNLRPQKDGFSDSTDECGAAVAQLSISDFFVMPSSSGMTAYGVTNHLHLFDACTVNSPDILLARTGGQPSEFFERHRRAQSGA